MGMSKGRLKFLPVVGIISLILIFASCSSKEPSKGEVALFDLAAKAQAANDFKQALDIYNKIIEEFPSSPRIDKALFMTGFIHYENLHDTTNAALAFQQVIDKYPQSDLFDDAKFMLETIKSGQDPFTTLQNKVNR
jgi:outer membrane protein assembly factor BamD (BamD/ComL family)